jgi:hypothetical protein
MVTWNFSFLLGKLGIIRILIFRAQIRAGVAVALLRHRLPEVVVRLLLHQLHLSEMFLKIVFTVFRENKLKRLASVESNIERVHFLEWILLIF